MLAIGGLHTVARILVGTAGDGQQSALTKTQRPPSVGEHVKPGLISDASRQRAVCESSEAAQAAMAVVPGRAGAELGISFYRLVCDSVYNAEPHAEYTFFNVCACLPDRRRADRRLVFCIRAD